MSAPAIGIGHWMSGPVTPVQDPAHVPLMCAPSIEPHGAVFQILHMPYGFRNSEIQNRESGYSDFSMP